MGREISTAHPHTMSVALVTAVFALTRTLPRASVSISETLRTSRFSLTELFLLLAVS
jgi:hypothetical protein